MYTYLQVNALMFCDTPVVGALLEAGADPTLNSGQSHNLAPFFKIALWLVRHWSATSS
jgi:hypothetical protein